MKSKKVAFKDITGTIYTADYINGYETHFEVKNMEPENSSTSQSVPNFKTPNTVNNHNKIFVHMSNVIWYFVTE